MIPLTMAPAGADVIIKRISGSDDVKRRIESLGFTVGGAVTVINTLAGSVIVNVKESRIAIGKDMANRIMI